MPQITVADGLDCAWLKRHNLPLDELARADRIKMMPGQKLHPVEIQQHDKVTSLLIFKPPLSAMLTTQGVPLKIKFDAAYAHTPHIKIIADAPVASLGQPNTHRRLKVPYRSQRDNFYNPNGACNVTCIAMCLLYHGITGDGHGQLEDELYEAMERQGLDRHSPSHLRDIAEQYGVRDEFVSNAQIQQIKLAIDEGIPVVTHGYLTSFGHIIVIVGYNDKGFIAHDPYGEWHDWGYNLNSGTNQRKGEGLTYSYGLFRRLFMHDGGAWCHFISASERPPTSDVGRI